MQTVLFIHNDLTIREQAIQEAVDKWGISPFDCVRPSSDTLSIGIKEIRTFMKRLSLLPQQGTHTAGIISDGERLTMEAQQALLKTLEEPPAHAYIAIGVSNIHAILGTIVSRCECRLLTSTVNNSAAPAPSLDLQAFFALSKGQKIAHLSTLGKTKEDLLPWIDTVITTLRNELVNAKNHANTAHKTAFLHALLETRKYQENNVNILLQLEAAALALP